VAVDAGGRWPCVAQLQDHVAVEREPDEVLEAACFVGLRREEKPVQAGNHWHILDRLRPVNHRFSDALPLIHPRCFHDVGATRGSLSGRIDG
jgi:hypothetical protein